MYKTDANDILIVNCDDLYCLEEKVKKRHNAKRLPPTSPALGQLG